jgi:hypothetical protein
MTPNRPIRPPLRGTPALDPERKPVGVPATDCTILDRCDQCGRRLARPHVSNRRAYCGDCCPTCARYGFSK